MQLPKERIAYLLEIYTSKNATAEEEQELMEWMHEAKEDEELKGFIENLWRNHQPGIISDNVNWDNMFDRIVQKDKVYSIAPQREKKLALWPRIAAVAAVIIVIAVGSYFLAGRKTMTLPVAESQVEQPAGDILPPSSNKASLTLGNGKVIILEQAGTGSLADEGISNAAMVNSGELAYNSTAATSVEFHTLNVPRGSKPMQLQLADGSEVWLNAASSITFPNVFIGPERIISVTGEVYVEIAHDVRKPFILTKGEMKVEVLGTKFNVNSYDDEAAIRVTLLEGSVKVMKGTREGLLHPGQQAKLTGDQISILDDVNLEEVMAWKNGLFEFNNTDIQTIMRQIERWYDVEVVFDDPVSRHFNGTIQRQVSVSKVLDMLEKAGGIEFQIVGKKVIVKKF